MSIFLKEVVCAKCKEKFGLTAEAEAMLRRNQQGFSCPWGHSNYFPAGKTDVDKLRGQLDEERRARQRAEQAMAYENDRRREAEEEAKRERNRANGYKGHATRITRRAKAGVCPCCNRTFAQLARHMATKHPQFTPMPPELEVIDGGRVA